MHSFIYHKQSRLAEVIMALPKYETTNDMLTKTLQKLKESIDKLTPEQKKEVEDAT